MLQIAPVAVLLTMRADTGKRAATLECSKVGVNSLFGVPLIPAARALSFAHGSDDVAVAIGQLAGVFDALSSGSLHDEAGIPFWVMMLGATAFVVGLLLFGLRVIPRVGHELTSLDTLRAWCFAISATRTVIIASSRVMPISTTHITRARF